MKDKLAGLLVLNSLLSLPALAEDFHDGANKRSYDLGYAGKTAAGAAVTVTPHQKLVSADLPITINEGGNGNVVDGTWEPSSDSSFKVKEVWYQVTGNFSDLSKFHIINAAPASDGSRVNLHWEGNSSDWFDSNRHSAGPGVPSIVKFPDNAFEHFPPGVVTIHITALLSD